MSIFPAVSPTPVATATELPLCREVAWDFAADAPILHNGQPVQVTGREAVKVWAWNAIHTERHVYGVWTGQYGSDIDDLIGRPFTDELKNSEAARYVRECLLQNPYITGVTITELSFTGSLLRLTAVINTIYGEVDLNV